MDKSGANYAGLANINLLLILAGFATMIDICQVKYLNNIIEQDHRFIKKITKPMMGFKAFHSAQATIAGIETAHMIRKGQLSEEYIPAYKQFMALAGRRATARLMIDFGTPVTKIDSPRGESIVPQFVLRPLQLRTKAATLKLPH